MAKKSDEKKPVKQKRKLVQESATVPASDYKAVVDKLRIKSQLVGEAEFQLKRKQAEVDELKSKGPVIVKDGIYEFEDIKMTETYIEAGFYPHRLIVHLEHTV